MATPKIEKPRGVLNLEAGQKKFQLSMYLPVPKLVLFVEHYWIVRWDLRDEEPYVQQNLPHPTVHLVFERGHSRIVGLMHGKFSQRLEGQGCVFGIKFRPGGFYPFLKSPLSAFTDKSLPIESVFPVHSTVLENTILSKESDEDMVEVAEGFLRQHMPARDQNLTLITDMMNFIVSNHDVTRVEDIADRFGIARRTLQRLFSQYVGIGPKWVIRRYRLHEAAEQLAAHNPVDLPTLALNLGYFDEAHFNKDFKMYVGSTPGAYAKNSSK